MKRAKEALEIVNKIDEKYNQTGAIKQFTIDMIEHFSEELNGCVRRIYSRKFELQSQYRIGNMRRRSY